MKSLEGLTAHHGLSSSQHDRLLILLEALELDAHAPTAVRRPELAVDVHIADSLVALEIDAVRSAATLTDLGSGAGFPGVPLAIALPEAEVTLIESQGRRCRFLESVLAKVEVENAHVVCTRAEEWSQGAAAQDVAVARALAPQPVVLEYAAPLLALGGTLVDWRGRRMAEEEELAIAAAEELGLERLEILRVEPFAGARDHHLHLYRKVIQTPTRFPRRAGMARKRPLGSRGPS